MQALIDFIVKNLLALWPIARVYEWEQGLRVRRGLIVEELESGLHWRWWFLDEVYKWPSNEMAVDLETGTIVTSDGEGVSVSANISWRVLSIATMYRSVWHAEKTLGLIAVGHIASECASMTWQQLRRRQSVEAKLLESLNEVMEERGVGVMAVRLTDCVPTRAYRHYHDGKVPVGEHTEAAE